MSRPNAPASSAIFCAASASRDGYILLLRNLLPAYQAMERGLARHRKTPGFGALANYRLDRAPAIEADLGALCGKSWQRDIPLLPAGDNYARRIAEAAEGNGARLIAHAYTRYLGDLSGGQILQRLLARSLELRPAELSFYDFPRYADLAALKAGLSRGARPGRQPRDAIQQLWSRKAPSPLRSISICPAPCKAALQPAATAAE